MKTGYNNSKYYKRVYAKPSEYKGIKFRSTLEKDFAMFLDGHIVRYKGVNYYHKPVKWEYESKVFELLPQVSWTDRTERETKLKTISRNKSHTLQRVVYTPDYYLPEYNLYIETKGVQFDDSLFHLRLRLFKHLFPNEAIWIVRHHSDFSKLDEVISNLSISNK